MQSSPVLMALQPPLLLRPLVQYLVLSMGVLTTHGSYKTAPFELLTAVGIEQDAQGPPLHD